MRSRKPPPRLSPALAMTAALAPTLIILGALIAATFVTDATAVLLAGAASALTVFYLARRAVLRRSQRAHGADQARPATSSDSAHAPAYGSSVQVPRPGIARATEGGAR